MFGFEKLEVWQLSIAFAQDVYVLTKSFPAEERFGLTSQIRRAAVSVSSNIAEGSGRNSKTDFARFLAIAYGSLMETVSQSHLALRLGFIDQTQLDEVIRSSERIAKMLSGLRSSLTKNQN